MRQKASNFKNQNNLKPITINGKKPNDAEILYWAHKKYLNCDCPVAKAEYEKDGLAFQVAKRVYDVYTSGEMSMDDINTELQYAIDSRI